MKNNTLELVPVLSYSHFTYHLFVVFPTYITTPCTKTFFKTTSNISNIWYYYVQHILLPLAISKMFPFRYKYNLLKKHHVSFVPRHTTVNEWSIKFYGVSLPNLFHFNRISIYIVYQFAKSLYNQFNAIQKHANFREKDTHW